MSSFRVYTGSSLSVGMVLQLPPTFLPSSHRHTLVVDTPVAIVLPRRSFVIFILIYIVCITVIFFVHLDGGFVSGGTMIERGR